MNTTIEVKTPVVETASFVVQTGPVGHPINLTAPAITAPGGTGQLFIAATADWRIVDVSVGADATVVRVLAGSADLSLPEGGTWREVLSVQDVRVAKGQYVNVLVRNDAATPVRLRASVSVVEEKAPAAAASTKTSRSSASRSAARSAATEAPKGPAEIVEHGEPVRFLLGRGLVSYVVMFLRGGQIPRQMHSAVLASFEGTRMVLGPESKPRKGPSQEAEIVLGEHVRAEIGRAVRFRMAPNLSMADRAIVAEVLTDAIDGLSDRPRVEVATASSPEVLEKVSRHLRDRTGQAIFMPGEHFTLKEPDVDLKAENAALKARVAELEKMIEDAAPDSSPDMETST